MASRKPTQPTLTSQVVANDDALSEAIDKLLAVDRRHQVHRREIMRRQTELRAVVDDEAWSAYLHLEQAVNVRFGDALQRVARWAFEQGRRR